MVGEVEGASGVDGDEGAVGGGGWAGWGDEGEVVVEDVVPEAEGGFGIGMDDKRASRIALERGGAIDDSAVGRPELRQWAVGSLLLFKHVFGPLIDSLQVPKSVELTAIFVPQDLK